MTSKTTPKSARGKTLVEPRFGKRILGPPCAAAVNHLIEAATLIELAEVAILRENRGMPESSSLIGRYQSSFRDELLDASNLYRKSKAKLMDEFRARWFVWRVTLPISIIVGVQPAYIFEAGMTRMAVPRSLISWISMSAGNLVAMDIADVIGRNRTTVSEYIKKAKIGVAQPDSEFYKLMTDLLDFEAEYLWDSKELSPPLKQA